MEQDLHPIVIQMHPGAEQLPAVLARGSDIAVTAGAGAGKTRTLVARYLALLAEGAPLHSVVAITFTRKAAREMRNRIREAVRRYLETPNLSAAERGYWQELATGLDAARIGTIHSLCAEILRHHPAEAAIDPRFELLDEGQQALLQRQAVEAALGRATDDPRTVRLFGDFGELELQKVLRALLQQRLDVEKVWREIPADLWSLWEAQVTPSIRAFVTDSEVQLAFTALQSLVDGGMLAQALAAGDAFALLLPEILACWTTIQAAQAAGDWVTISQQLHPLRTALKQVGKKAHWAPGDPRPTVKTLQSCFDTCLEGWGKHPFDLGLDREVAREVLPALLALYDIAQALYTQAKAARRALDFDDLEFGALGLLQEYPEVRAYWQSEITALLVDEFQDTNARQRDLLEALNGGAGKVFVVGDGKQSIYRFRGADVTVFRGVWEEIAQRGQTLALATSYRAHTALIESLNALLQPVLGEADPARPYVEPFAPLRPYREAPLAGLHAPFVEVHLVAGAKGDGALRRAAQVLVNRLQTLIASDILIEESDPETGCRQQRRLDYGDVVILCRASSSFADYENALEAAGVPFLTVAGRGFYERPEVRDVLNALQAIATPVDDLALAGLLRSPVGGLSDMALYRLRQMQKETGLPSLWEALNVEDLAFLEAAPLDEAAPSEKAAPRAVAVRNLIAHLNRMAGRVPVADVLKAFLDATDYRAALLRAGQGRGAGNLAKLLADAHASQIVSVETFLEYVQQLRDAGTREGEARSVARGAVQLLTVHAAKGLEFPVVVLGDVTREPPGTRGLLLDPQLGIVPPVSGERDGQTAKSAVYALAQARAADQEAAESDRLLYVAATRAQEALLLSGVTGRGKTNWLARLPLALPELACDPAKPEPVLLDVGGVSIACYSYAEDCDLPLLKAAPLATPSATLPDTLPLLAPLRIQSQPVDAEAEAALQDPPPRTWRVVPVHDRAVAPAWVVGQVVHRALERWRFPEDPDAGAFSRWAEAEARSCGIMDEAELANAVRRAARMLIRFQATPLYERMSGALRRLHEAPYSLLTPAGLEQGIIDVLFETPAGWTLVEFKTDAFGSSTTLQKLLGQKDYIAQVRRYVRAAEQLLGVRPQAVLCLLNVGGAVQIVEDIENW